MAGIESTLSKRGGGDGDSETLSANASSSGSAPLKLDAMSSDNHRTLSPMQQPQCLVHGGRIGRGPGILGGRPVLVALRSIRPQAP